MSRPDAADREGDTYQKPAHGWTCFHCGETFTTPGSARDHFGIDQSADPACRIKIGEERGLVMALRRAENELARYRSEDSDMDRQFHAMRADHARALVREEEKGYAAALRDVYARLAFADEAEKAIELALTNLDDIARGEDIPSIVIRDKMRAVLASTGATPATPRREGE